MNGDLWILIEQDSGKVEDPFLSLLGEAVHIKESISAVKNITAIVIGADETADLQKLSCFGADRIIVLACESPDPIHDQLVAQTLSRLASKARPFGMLTLDSALKGDLLARVSASLQVPALTRVLDLKADNDELTVTRAISCGYLFEERLIAAQSGWIISFVPSVFGDPVAGETKPIELIRETIEAGPDRAGTTLLEVIEAEPGQVALEEADIIVSGGRGAGKKESFQIVHDLAAAIGGSVGGTRPVIDNAILPYERQIGQTGKYVSPRLIINCGISGANEYTAGIEKAQFNIAINTDPRARIFRFADLGIVGDVQAVVAELIARLKKRQANR